jgi:murein DD-endopeptidase MepM/ murein hydrolase activator NlpD
MTPSPTKHVTIMLIPDGASDQQYKWRVPMFVVKLVAAAFGLIVIGIVLFFVFYGTMVARTAMAERLKEENEELKRYRYKVKLLEENLMQTRDLMKRLTKLAGIDYQFPEIPPDSLLPTSDTNQMPAVINRPLGQDLSLPVGLPVQGSVSKEFEFENKDSYHPGVDIACKSGTPVLATGSGQVVFAGIDSTYGKMLIVKNNDSITTLYGHNDSLLVQMGEHVQVGSRIALSGNTGISTAPHVHYEIRVNNKPIDPLENPYDKETFQQ